MASLNGKKRKSYSISEKQGIIDEIKVNAWINVDKNEPVSSKMMEDKITFSGQQEPQSELESDNDDYNEEAELMPSMKAVVQHIETTLKWAELYENSAATTVCCIVQMIKSNRLL